MVLARTFTTEPDKWSVLQEALEHYGHACGLFESVKVRRLGQSEGSPFQLLVRVTGPPKNLVDVGYGVSQALPILVDSFLSAKGHTFLLQQPEVHLHPRAQAELGSFLCRLVAHDKKQFVIETHSDYLLDRVSMEVRSGRSISPEQLVVLFFERCGSDIEIHPLRMDESGNIHNAPPSYRRFFLEEEQRYLLG
jgi:predicted ATPase